MRLAFFLDNHGMASRGSLSDPLLGNPAIGGTEYAFLAVTSLLQDTEVDPLLLLTTPQRVDGLKTPTVALACDLPDALRKAEAAGAMAFVFRPGVLAEHDWPALETSPLPLVAWFHNLGCVQQARTEALPSLAAWVLVSGAQLDYFRHSRLSRKAVVLPNPVAVPPEAGRPRSLEEASSAHDLAFVGAITPFKGFDRLAGQWGAIAAACPLARLRVFGGADLYGPRASKGELTSFERHCRRLLEASGHLDRVVFEGTQGLERYQAYTDVAVGVVNPSGCDETFCLSAAEFSACSIPVVSARRHALVQTVRHGATGLLVRSEMELARSCIELLQNHELAWRLGQEGRGHVQDVFGMDRVRAGWIQLARHVMTGTPPPLLPASTPKAHEQRWLRELWGSMLVIPGWPSWPTVKEALKKLVQGGEQAMQPRGVALLAGLVALLVWALVVFGKYGGNPSGLARIGDQMPLSPRLQGQELVVLQGKRGNDGQQFLALALDPIQLDAGTSAAVDNPIYRGKRLLYPLLAWVLGLGQPRLILWVMGLINVVCIGCAAGLVARWAQLHQRSPLWGLAVLALPGYWITLTLSTADLLATTLMLASGLAWKQHALRASWASLTGALLTRETAFLAWAATGLSVLWERRWRWLLPLALVPLPLWGWTAMLRGRFPAVHDGSLAQLHFTWPLGGIATKAGQLLGLGLIPGPPMGQSERLFDALCFLLWLMNLLLLALAAWRGWGGRWIRIACGLNLLPALCTSTQILARFPDYTRVWIDLSGLVLVAMLSAHVKMLKAWLTLSAVTGLGYLAGFMVMAP